MLWLLLLCSVIVVRGQYEVPAAKIEPLYPKGFRVSIPDEEGIKLFAFHGKINEELNGREGGTFSRDITKAKNGRWTFYDRYTKLKKGDVLYYWTYVDYFDGRNKLGYVNDDQSFVVEELIGDQPTSTQAPPVVIGMSGKSNKPSCEGTATITNTGTFCKGDLIFNEDFNGDLASSKFWTVEQRYSDSPDYEFVIYMNNPQTLQVDGGFLKIKPVLSEEVLGTGFVTSHVGYDFKEKCTAVPGSTVCKKRYDAGFLLPPIVSSQVITKNKFAFKYGKIEIRAKLPKGDWIYPELYLNPFNENYGPNYESGQIRIAFTPGNTDLNRILQGGVLLGSNEVSRNYGIKHIQERQKTWCDDFHKFTVTWKPGSISVSVDDTVYGNIYPPTEGFASLGSYLNVSYAQRWRKGSALAPFDEEMYITLGVGVGGFNFEDRTDGSKPWRNGERLSLRRFYDEKNKWKSTWNEGSALEVDYVKIWAL